MRRLLLSLALILCAAPAVAQADDDSLLRNMVWTERPDARDVIEAYPPAAFANRVRGRATLDCTVREDLGLDCTVLRERPLRREFGEAALRLSALYRSAPTTKDGRLVVGERVRIPVRFGGRRGTDYYIRMAPRNPPPGNPVYSNSY